MGTRRRGVNWSALAFAAAVATGAYAFAASNTLGPSDAGAGAGSVSGYTASGVSFSLDAGDPTRIDAVTFSINPAAASQVRVRLTSGGAWYSCTNAAGSVSCATTSPQASLAAADRLDVVATG